MGQLTGLLVLLLAGLVLAAAVLSGLMAAQVRRPARRSGGYAAARGLAVDPGERNMQFEEWRLERPDAARLPVWEIRSRQPTAVSRQPPLTAVLVHAWGESRIDALERIEPWRALCDRVVLYDLRGHGDAAGGASRLGHNEEADLLALLDRLGDGLFVLAGRGLGAVICLTAAAGASGVRSCIVGVVIDGAYRDFHRWFRGRLASAGMPTRPLSDLAMLWLRLGGLRFPDTEVAATALGCPLLDLDGVGRDQREQALREFVQARAPSQPRPAASASSSGPR